MSAFDTCCICLATAEARGGEFLVSPGCCGKWYHQSCIRELKANGKNFCPACMKAFPESQISLPTPAPAPAAPVVPAAPIRFPFQQIPTFNPFNQQSPFAPQPHSIFPSNPFFPTTTASPNREIEEDLLDDEDAMRTEEPATSITDQHQVNVSVIPEVNPISIRRNDAFFMQVSAQFVDNTDYGMHRNGIDCVCILDNSGSMSGSKITNLKFAVEYIVSMLSKNDRLSIVIFNSRATVVHGLWKMNQANKERTNSMLRSIRAEGGTDIYDGMRTGWDILKNRKSRNPATCVFLLTDGQDGSYLTEKKALAAEMREAGASLFVYGFGADHDSAHMNQIANAGEGSFVYIETNDTVVDAFGGALGTQQGTILRNVEFQVAVQSTGVMIEECLSGSYRADIQSDRRSMTIRLADLFNGEKRDFIVKLFVPEIAEPSEQYAMLTAQATYRRHGTDGMLHTDAVLGTVNRVAPDTLAALNPQKHPEVDSQVMRLLCAKAINDARRTADEGHYKDATAILEAFRAQLIDCISFKMGNPMTKSLLEEINELFDRVKSREAYEYGGGRAQCLESTTNHSRQRVTYAKSNRSYTYQTMTSAAAQSSATVSKTSRR